MSQFIYLSIIISPVYATAFSCVALMCKPGKQMRSNKYLMSLMFTLMGQFFVVFHFFSPSLPSAGIAVLDFIWRFLYMSTIVWAYFTARSLLRLKGVRRSDWYWMYLPAILTLLYVILYILAGQDVWQAYIYKTLYAILPPASMAESPYFVAFEWLAMLINMTTAIGFCYFFFWAWRSLRDYDRLLDDFFSDVPAIMRSLSYAIYAALVLDMLAGCVLVLFPHVMVNNRIVAIICSVFVSLSFVALTFYYWRLRFTAGFLYDQLKATDMRHGETEIEELRRGQFAPVAMAPLTRLRLQTAIDKFVITKGFCDPDVNLITMAESFKTNRTYLSRFLSETYHLTFFEFITRLRVEEAQHLLTLAQRSRNPISMEELARQTGFTSVASLFRSFNRIVGVPPTEWGGVTYNQPRIRAAQSE